VRAHEHQFKPPIRDCIDVHVIEMHRFVLLDLAGEGPLSMRGLPVVA
jgi:hypothetical protein